MGSCNWRGCTGIRTLFYFLEVGREAGSRKGILLIRQVIELERMDHLC